MASKVTFTDIQFPKKYDAAKFRRLNDELRSLTRSLNSVIETLGEAAGDGGAFTHELASTTGIGNSHTVEGLEPGMVLVAIADNNVAFRRIDLDDLSDVDVGESTDGQTLVRSGNRWVAQDLPGVAGLLDPGDNKIVFWDEDADDLSFLDLGTGLVIAGGMLVLDASALDHGNLHGLEDDDHPQYPLIAFPETITGDWTFTGEVGFERSVVDVHLTESSGGTDGNRWSIEITEGVLELFLEGDHSEVGESVLHVARDGLSITEISIAEFITLDKGTSDVFVSAEYGSSDEEVLHSFYGDMQISGALAVGDLSIFTDGTDSHISTVGDTYWDNGVALDTGGSLYLGFDRMEMRAASPELILRSLSSDTDEGGWGWFAKFGQMQMATVNDDGSIGEAWVTVDSIGGVISDSSINFSAGSLKWNGARILTEADASSGTVTSISAGTNISVDSTNPAIPVVAFTPAGSTTQIQFNSGGALAASGDFTWDGTSFTLTVGGNTVGGNISLGQAPSGAANASTSTIRGTPGGSTSGIGGLLTLTGGTATDGNGGSLTVRGADGVAPNATSRNGGAITILAGAGVSGVGAVTGGTGGSVSVTGGAGTLNRPGGSVAFSGGAGGATGSGGGLSFTGGAGATVSNITFQAGTPTAGDGANIVLNASSGVGTNKNGGDISLSAGVGTGTGTQGGLRVTNMTTTGAQTATFSATNKPGTGTTSPSNWLIVKVGGTTYYSPLWQ